MTVVGGYSARTISPSDGGWGVGDGLDSEYCPADDAAVGERETERASQIGSLGTFAS